MQTFLKYKKQIILTISIIILMIIIFGIYILHVTLQNIEYSKNQAHVIALNRFPGTIIPSNIEYENLQTYYELKIKNSNQEIIEVIIDAKDGTITSYEYKEE